MSFIQDEISKQMLIQVIKLVRKLFGIYKNVLQIHRGYNELQNIVKHSQSI